MKQVSGDPTVGSLRIVSRRGQRARLPSIAAVCTTVTRSSSTGSCNIDQIVAYTQQHFKQKHANSVVSIDGYTLFRRDRTGRRGRGVAIYVLSNIQSSVLADDDTDFRRQQSSFLNTRLA